MLKKCWIIYFPGLILNSLKLAKIYSSFLIILLPYYLDEEIKVVTCVKYVLRTTGWRPVKKHELRYKNMDQDSTVKDFDKWRE